MNSNEAINKYIYIRYNYLRKLFSFSNIIRKKKNQGKKERLVFLLFSDLSFGEDIRSVMYITQTIVNTKITCLFSISELRFS